MKESNLSLLTTRPAMGVAPPAHYIQQLRASLLSVSFHDQLQLPFLLLQFCEDSFPPFMRSGGAIWNDRGPAHDVRNLLQRERHQDGFYCLHGRWSMESFHC